MRLLTKSNFTMQTRDALEIPTDGILSSPLTFSFPGLALMLWLRLHAHAPVAPGWLLPKNAGLGNMKDLWSWRPAAPSWGGGSSSGMDTAQQLPTWPWPCCLVEAQARDPPAAKPPSSAGRRLLTPTEVTCNLGTAFGDRCRKPCHDWHVPAGRWHSRKS